MIAEWEGLRMIEILIVDDEPLVLLTLKSMCNWEAEGIHIIGEAENGKAALEFIQAHPSVDMVLTDVNMPVMDGLKFAETLKETGSSIPVVFLSSYSNFDYVRRALKSGACDYILKSEMDDRSLLELIHRVAANFVNPKLPLASITQEKESSRTALFDAITSGEAEHSSEENLAELFERCGFTILFPFHFMILKPGDIS
ncbi:MAG: response regulator, partial [Treponema sp.]|nr:response regulator [Treponema sp.]